MGRQDAAARERRTSPESATPRSGVLCRDFTGAEDSGSFCWWWRWSPPASPRFWPLARRGCWPRARARNSAAAATSWNPAMKPGFTPAPIGVSSAWTATCPTTISSHHLAVKVLRRRPGVPGLPHGPVPRGHQAVGQRRRDFKGQLPEVPRRDHGPGQRRPQLLVLPPSTPPPADGGGGDAAAATATLRQGREEV